MALFLGIDGGGTHTRALIGDEHGKVWGSGTGGCANYHHAGWDHAARAVGEAVTAARTHGGVTEEFDGVFLGLAGVDSDDARQHWRELAMQVGGVNPAARTDVDHDLRIALAGGLAGKPGIALVAGTGSCCFGRNALGASWKAGGWGALLDDGGSGYWLGVQALVAAVRAADGRGVPTALGARALAVLGAPSLREIMTRMISGVLRREEIAALAAEVMTAAADEPVARGVLERGAGELALMVGAVARRLFSDGDPTVVVVGGVGEAVAYAPLIRTAIAREVPEAHVAPAILTPVAGALMLALESAGCPAGAEVVASLRAIKGSS